MSPNSCDLIYASPWALFCRVYRSLCDHLFCLSTIVVNMSDEETKIIKLRGLPWNSTVKDILDFLKDCEVADGEKSVHLAISHRDGRPNGEAYVEMATLGDVDKAFEYNKNVLGHRYIESKSSNWNDSQLHSLQLCFVLVFNAKAEEFDTCVRRQNLVQQDTFIKLRGLPFSCKCDDIEQFFEGSTYSFLHLVLFSCMPLCLRIRLLQPIRGRRDEERMC